MNWFTLSGIMISATYIIIACVTYLNRKTRLHTVWTLFNLSVAAWGVGAILISLAADPMGALFAWKIAHVGIIFIPPTILHTVMIFCQSNNRFILVGVYTQAAVFALLSLFGLLFGKEVVFAFNSFYYIQSTIIYNIFFAIWCAIVVYSQIILINTYMSSSDLRRKQIQYFFVGVIVGFSGGLMNFPKVYGIEIYPVGNYLLPIYPFLVSYAMFKYRLMDVTLVITRTGIFLGVYSFVLGIPFAIGFIFRETLQTNFGQNWWMIPLILSTVLATMGPYMYIYLRRRAEDRMLQEQRQYQATLRQASLGMGQIKDLKRLLNLIVHVVTRAVKIENCKIFLRHEDSQQYILKAMKGIKNEKDNMNKLPFDSSLVHYFNQMKEPLVYEEIRQRRADAGGEGLKELETIMEGMDASLVVPSFIEQKLIAVISLGKKRSGKLYTYDDLAVFAILANQSALAIENAQFYEDMKRTHVQLMKAEKMATVGTMADGLSHQINNRLHAMGFIAGDLLDTVRLGLKNGVNKKNKELLTEIESGLERIQQNVKHGGEIVGGLLKYTRKGDQGYTAVDFAELLKSAFEMAQFKIKVNMLDVHRHFDDFLPQIKGNFTQLQEVFFNLIDNAYDAMMQRKDELGEEGYKPRLDIFAREKDAKIEIILQDNGMGVKDVDMHKLFTPFFTTKATSKKGTGLGLYVIRQIIEDNHGGKVNFSSKFQIGSETHIVLPIAVEKLG